VIAFAKFLLAFPDINFGSFKAGIYKKSSLELKESFL